MIGMSSVQASETFHFNVSANQLAQQHLNNFHYKYAVVEFDANPNDKTTMYFFYGYHGSSIIDTTTLGKSGNFTLRGHNKVYILPRSGMGCPVNEGATYCFGAGQNYSSTSILEQGGNIGYYGIRFSSGTFSGTITYY